MHHRQDAHQKGSDNSASARVSNQFQSRPFGLQAQSETTTPQQQETPDVETQLERALRFGPDFSRVKVRAEGPPPTIQQSLFFGEQRDQEEPVTDSMENPVRSMPASPVNLPPIQRLDAESVGNQPNPLAARMMPGVQRRDAESVGNQPNLAARMMPVVQRRDAESVGNQPNLAARMMPVVQRQSQPTVSIQRQPWIQRIEEQPEANMEEEDESAPVQAKLENATVQRQSEANVEEEAEDSLPVQTQLENATVQRQSEGEQESEKEDLPMQLVQPKLTIGAPGDKYEIEADSMAERVMSMNVPDAPAAIQRKEVGEEDPLQRSPLATSITPLIQRQSEEGEDIQTKPSVQQAGRDEGVQRRSSIENTLASQKGGGSPLDEDVRSFMEPRFGNDFSGVRVHTGSNAVQMNKELHAQAFTHGSDVYFNEGKYNPGSNSGKQLLAHELTHVVQQTGAKKLQRKPVPSRLENKETPQAKDLQRQPSSEEQEQKPLQAKQIPGGTTELSPDLTKAPPEANALAESEKTVSQTQPQTVTDSEAAPKTQPTTEAPDGVTTAAVPKPNSPETKPTPTGSVEGATEVKPGATTEPNPKPNSPETKPSGATEATQEKAPPQALPMPAGAAIPQTQGATQAPAEGATKKAIAQNNASLAQPAAATAEAAAAPESASSAAPAMDSGGGSAEASAESEAPGGAENADIEAAAADPSAKVELDPAERDSALASLAEGSGGGGAAAGGGGGGGGAAIADKPTPPVPEVSQAEPSAALLAVSNLPPAQLMAGLGSVGAAVGNTVGKQRAELAANPPQMESPSGSPKTNKESAADREAFKGKDPKAVEKTPEGQAKPVPQPKPLPLPGAPPTAAVSSPKVQGNAEGKLDPGDAQKLQASVRNIPTSDPALQQVSAGATPRLELQGNADPQQAQQQRGELEKGIADAHSKGQQELAQPMGENEIYPKVQPETLRAEGIGGGSGAAAGATTKAAGGTAGGGGAGGDEAVSIIAQQEHSQEIQAGVAKAQAEIAGKRQEHSAKVEEEKARSNEEIAQLQTENSAQQAAERTKAQAEVQQQRSAWQKEQDVLITKSRKDADEAVSKGNKDVQQEQTQAETKASEHIQKGESEAAAARQKGEQEAEKERQKGEQESGGILGWLADKAKAFFDGIKQAIQKAFEVARAAVKAAIEGAQKLATAVIETARQAIVGIIKAVGAALIAIGDVLLAAFPEIRDRFRNAIKGVVKAAETAVNALADTLKKGVQAALNLLGKGLDAALGLLEKGMLAAVDIASKAVSGAIKLADAAIKAIGAFAVLAKDIAGNPGQWLSNLGAGAMDGIKNHFWGAFQTAVKEWFSQKVEEVLGLGMTVWNVLKQGGINTAEVGKMAWEGIKSAIPAVLIGLLIEKVVSMIVPAAGTVLLIIEGLQAAWGTVSRILQAFERFMAFLKAVKTGQAGPPFGAAVAAAGVVVIDFVSNWLLKRLRGPASKVAGKIKEIAKKIGNKVKKTMKKVGQKLRGGMKKLGDKAKKLKEKFFGKKDKPGNKHTNKNKKLSKEEAQQQEIQKRVEKVQRELPPKVNSLLAKNPSKLRLKAQLALWRVQYRLQYLKLIESGKSKAEIEARVNPKIKIADTYFFDAADLMRVVDRVAQEYIPKQVAAEHTLPGVHDSTGDPSKAMAGMIGNRQHQFGTDSASRPVGVSSTVENDQFGNEVLKIRPFEGGSGPKYETLSKGLEGMGPQVSEYYRNIFMAQTPIALPPGKKELADVGYGLWYVHEPSHNRVQGSDGPVPTWANKRDLTYSMMLTELMGRGEVDPKEAFSPEKLGSSRSTSEVTSHPAAFGGAQQGARRMNSQMRRREKALNKGKDYQWELGNNENAQERYYREKQLIEKWFSLHKAEFLKAYPTQPSETQLEEFVRSKLKEYFANKSAQQ